MTPSPRGSRGEARGADRRGRWSAQASARRSAHLRRPAAVVALSLLLFALPATATAEGLEGWVELGVLSDFDLARTPEQEFSARLGYGTPRLEGVTAFFEAQADTVSRNVQVRDAFADAQLGETGWQLRFGRGKKVLGWEYEDSQRERLALHRSLVYRFLEANGLVGRDYFTHARWGEARAALHYNEAGDLAAIASWTPALSTRARWGSWLLVQRDQDVGGQRATFAAATGPAGATARYRWASELFAGVNPPRTGREEAAGAGRTVFFAGAKAEGGLLLGRWLPYVQGSALAPDLRGIAPARLQGILGLRVSFSERLRLAAELEFFHDDPGPSFVGRLPRSPVGQINARYFVP